MKRVLFICAVFLFVTGCVQTRQQAMQQEKEALELQKRIDSLAEKVDTLDRNIVNLSEDVRQSTDVKLKQAEKGALGKVEKEEQALPVEVFYGKAYSIYKKGDYNHAVIEFDSFLAAYPDTDYSDNALYWKGECYYSMGEFAVAIRLFEDVVSKFANGNKAPHTQLKIGYSYNGIKR
ncbi:MAG: tetratricopeptide repeat protein [Proteobacteria bacterium]|nr:tetratricopeptide repeat protein [Pseudomonadota bacterium]